MMNYNKVLMILMIFTSMIITPHLKAQSIDELEKLYIGKWVNIEDNSKTITIEKLKTGYLLTKKEINKKEYNAYFQNNILFCIQTVGMTILPLPLCIDNENRLLLPNIDLDENCGTVIKYKKVK